MLLTDYRLLSCAIVLLYLLPAAGYGTTIHVPVNQPTIQAGIDAALESDTVLVAPATHTGEGNHGIDFGGMNLVLMSEAGPENTLVNMPTDGDYSEFRAILLENSESDAAIVEGFTIGGGIECSGSSPTIVGNIITAGTGEQGGGLYISQGSPIIVNNLIHGNLAYAVPGPIGSTFRGEGGRGFLSELKRPIHK